MELEIRQNGQIDDIISNICIIALFVCYIFLDRRLAKLEKTP